MTTEELYRTMSDDELLRLRRAFELDREAVNDPRNDAFVAHRLELIDAILHERHP